MSNTEGRVLRAQSSHYVVQAADGELVQCRARRQLRQPTTAWPAFPVPGDRVEWQLAAGGSQGVIEAVLPRANEIARARSGKKHVILANLELLVAVAPVRAPNFDRSLLDRLLATAERNHVPAHVCLHKIDLAEPAEFATVCDIYTRAGYPVQYTSVVTGAGIDALRQALIGRVCAFLGPSGAGKSHLLSCLQPGLNLRTGELGGKSGQGRHTTTRVDLHRTEFGALLVDTPGVREFNLWNLDAAELRDLFPDLRALQEQCGFGGCMHDHEPQCAVKQGVDSGRLDAGRYHSYRALLAELSDTQAERPRSRRRRSGRREES